MFGSFSRGWQLIKASWAVLQADRELLVFPIVSAFSVILVSLTFLIPAGILFGVFSAAGGEAGGDFIGFVLLFIYYLVTYGVGIYFNTALIGAAMIRLDGGDPTLGDGIKIANERLGSIISYAAISATVGLILRWLEDRGFLGQIASGIIGFAWGLVAFLVIPVLVAENLSAMDAVKRSGELLKQTWGEQITGNFGIGAVFAVIYIAVIFVLGFGLFGLAAAMESGFLIALSIGIIIIVIATIATIQGALSGIFQAALYRYAASGTAPDNFDIELIRGAFKSKRKRG